jgi:hypothetical protein
MADLQDWPISLKARDDREGILHAVAQVEKKKWKSCKSEVSQRVALLWEVFTGSGGALQTV